MGLTSEVKDMMKTTKTRLVMLVVSLAAGASIVRSKPRTARTLKR